MQASARVHEEMQSARGFRCNERKRRCAWVNRVHSTRHALTNPPTICFVQGRPCLALRFVPLPPANPSRGASHPEIHTQPKQIHSSYSLTPASASYSYSFLCRRGQPSAHAPPLALAHLRRHLRCRGVPAGRPARSRCSSQIGPPAQSAEHELALSAASQPVPHGMTLCGPDLQRSGCDAGGAHTSW